MSKKMFFSYMLIVLLLIGCSSQNKTTDFSYSLDHELLMSIARNSIQDTILGTNSSVTIPEGLKKRNDTVYVDIYVAGTLRARGTSNGSHVGENTRRAAALAAGASRNLTSYELASSRILITFPHEMMHVEKKTDTLKEEFSFGITGVYLATPYGDRVLLPHDGTISGENYITVLLGKLCLSRGFSFTCWNWTESEIFFFNAQSYLESTTGRPLEIYRAVPLYKLKDVDKETVLEAVIKGREFLIKMQEPEGKFHYIFFPVNNRYGTGDRGVRQVLTLYALTIVSTELGDHTYQSQIDKGIRYFLSLKKESSSNAFYIKYGNESSELGNTAVLLLALTYGEHFQNYEKEAIAMGEYLLSMQQADGSLKINRTVDIDYYPGESLLALMHLYKKTGDQRYLYAVERAFPYYRNHFRINKSAAFIPWQTQAYALAYEVTGNNEYADYIFEMNDWLLPSQCTNLSNTSNCARQGYVPLDFIGGFYRIENAHPTISTAVYLEGLSDALKIAKAMRDDERVDKYSTAIRLAIPFVLRLQFNENNNYYVKSQDLVVGGFKLSPFLQEMRIDNTDHGVVGLLKSIKALE